MCAPRRLSLPWFVADLAPESTPFALLGGAEGVGCIAQRFYDRMETDEPALAALHPCDAEGRVSAEVRERFRLFLIGWLGGPQDYMAQHGHPRLRMRHASVPVTPAMRDAWLRAMASAFDDAEAAGHRLDPSARQFALTRLAEVAAFLRNA